MGVNHSIGFSVEGRAGEIKTVSHTPSEDGVLRLFRAQKMVARDDHDGYDTIVVDGRTGEHWPIIYPGHPTAFFPAQSIYESVYANTCHPRLPIVFTVEFLKDSHWHGALIGRATVVQNEGVYATMPLSPCDRPRVELDVYQPQRGWYEGQEIDDRGRLRCDRCWYEHERHPNWPWRSRAVKLRAIVPPGMADFYVPVERQWHANRMNVVGFDDHGSYDETQHYLKHVFCLRVFGAEGREKPLVYAHDDKGPWAGFGIGCLPGALLNPGERLHIRIENRSFRPELFEATIEGGERITS